MLKTIAKSTKTVAFVLIIINLIINVNIVNGKKYPCNYADTVNLTGSALRLKDGSYSFEGLLIPANLTAEYNFKVIDGIEYLADTHIRGCACLLKPCVTFCCPQGMRFDVEQHLNCTNQTSNLAMHTKDAHIEITYLNGTSKNVNILDNFLIRYEMGCKNKQKDRIWEWNLYENGSVARFDGRLYTTDEYCFTPIEQKKTWTLAPLTCERFQRGFRVWIFAICTFLAITINIAIVTVLLMKSVSKFKEKYERLVILYLCTLIIGFTTLGYLSLKNPMNLPKSICKTIGIVTYCFLMLSFMLLSIISFEFWRVFSRKAVGGWRRVVLYLVAIFLTILLQFAVQFAQDSKLPKYLKPGIGDAVCWFDTRLYGILLYYYLPIFIFLCICVVFCIKAYLAKHRLPSDLLNDQLTLSKSNFNGFIFYLAATCCVWLREMFVFLFAHWREHYFIIDLWSGVCVLGLAVIGLICFVCRNKSIDMWCQSRSENDDKSNKMEANETELTALK